MLLTGEQGSAKTSILNAFTGRYNPEERLYQKSNFSATTTPQIFQKTIETSVDKRMGTTYGPPIGKTMTIFIDDLNLPQMDESGTIPPVELLRQWIDHGYWYDKKDRTKVGFDFTHFLLNQGALGVTIIVCPL